MMDRSLAQNERKAKAIVELTEVVLTYQQSQLDAWMAGDRSLTPSFVEITSNFANQPKYHFGEVFVLRHYHRTAGWKGFAAYALGHQYPGSQRREAGRRKAAEILPAAKLRKLRAMRQGLAGGEPDLFLYDDSGRFKFVEVKKQTDRLRPSQLTCIAQILAVLQCEVDIVYLCEARRRHRPKRYAFDLTSSQGWAVTGSATAVTVRPHRGT